MKKLITAIMAAVVAAVMLCTLSACGAKETTPFKMKKEKGDDGYTCYGFKSEKDATLQVKIPAEYNGKAVQYVGSSAFAESDVNTVEISEGIEKVDRNAFRDCASLEAVSLPQSLTKIDMSAFASCTALKEIYIPAGVTVLEQWAFVNCSSLETVVIEGQIDTLGRESFKNCTNLKVIYLPETLTTIHPNALDGCDALEEIHFGGTVKEFLNIDFTWDWMSAENVLVCCADDNILMNDRKNWSDTDQQAYYPTDPMEADEIVPDSSESEKTEFINTSQTTQAIAPYHAIAMEHDGWIYYFDDNANLCRADGKMNNIEMFCERPLGTNWNQDDDAVNIIGVSDTDVMYITGLGRSFAVELASGQVQELVTDMQGEEVCLYGMSGEWIYYTRSNSGENILYRSGLSDGFAGEEEVISGDLGDLEHAYATDTYLVYVLDEGKNWSLYCAPLMDPQVPVWRDGGSGDYYAIGLVGADSTTAVYYKSGSYVTYSKYYTCDLAGGEISGGDKFPVGNYAYDADTQRVYFFNEHLVYAGLEDFGDFAAYYNQDGYANKEITLGWRITHAGDWFFFRKDFRGGGADCCIDSSGVTFMSLRGVV